MSNIHVNPVVKFDYPDEVTGKYRRRFVLLIAANKHEMEGIETLFDKGKEYAMMNRKYRQDKIKNLSILSHNPTYLEENKE